MDGIKPLTHTWLSNGSVYRCSTDLLIRLPSIWWTMVLCVIAFTREELCSTTCTPSFPSRTSSSTSKSPESNCKTPSMHSTTTLQTVSAQILLWHHLELGFSSSPVLTSSLLFATLTLRTVDFGRVAYYSDDRQYHHRKRDASDRFYYSDMKIDPNQVSYSPSLAVWWDFDVRKMSQKSQTLKSTYQPTI